MQHLLAVVVCWALVATAQDTPACDCSAAEAQAKEAQAEVAALKDQLASSQRQVSELQGELDVAKSLAKRSKDELHKLKDDFEVSSAAGEAFSVLGAVTKTSTIAGDVIQHLLDQTSLDDQVIDTVCGHVGTAKDFTANIVGQITAVDYNKVVKNLTNHEIYVSHVAPAVDKVAEGAQPYVDLYVSPALKSAKVYTDPAFETAKVTYASAAKAVEGDVLPALKRGHSEAMTEIPRLWALGVARLEVLIQPIFDAIARAAPQHAKALPKSTVDRVLLLCVLLVAAYYSLRLFSVFLRFVLKALIIVKVFYVVFRLVVLMPIRLISSILGYCFWFMTGFYCCGLCRRRKQDKALKESKANSKTNGAPQQASLEDLVSLLEGSKKKNKVEPAVKVLTDHAKSGKPMANKTFPASVQGKVVDKAVLDKALAKIGHKK